MSDVRKDRTLYLHHIFQGVTITGVVTSTTTMRQIQVAWLWGIDLMGVRLTEVTGDQTTHGSVLSYVVQLTCAPIGTLMEVVGLSLRTWLMKVTMRRSPTMTTSSQEWRAAHSVGDALIKVQFITFQMSLLLRPLQWRPDWLGTMVTMQFYLWSWEASQN